ncbi:MAG: DUF4115 domain-containing protein [Methylophaga sp.]|nr:DUF4115 domain-containing protein [Methylophaga sp.]
MTDVNDEQIQIETALSVGEILKNAREAKKFTIAEVSAQLRLVTDNIQALENGQWEQLHGRAYARGYFAIYVKFLGLPEDELLAGFNREYQSSATEPSLSNVAYVKENKPFPWLKSLSIIIVLVMTWFAYQQWLQFEDEALVEVTNNTLEAEQQDTNLFNESVVEPIVSDEELNNSSDRNFELAATSQTIEAIPDEVSEVPERLSDEITNQITLTEDENVQGELVETVEVIESKTNIGLQFSQDCWIKISDANNKVLINKLMKADTSIELVGKSPLKVSLGRASAVSIQVDNKDFDLSPYIEGDIARFSLGDKS